MQYMILRRADRQSETQRPAAAESALLLAALKPSESGVRVSLNNGDATVTRGPFSDTEHMIAGFAIIDAPSKEGAVEWLRRWPESDHPVELGGCAQVLAPDDAQPEGKRFAVLLRSSPALEAEAHVPQDLLDRLDAHNAAEARSGVLLAADGLRSSARGARVKVAPGAFSVIDGPFTEIKEMIAGFWLIRVPTLEDAIGWATRNPYPTGPQVELEIRQLYDASDSIDAFTPDLEAAEQRMRAEQLEAGMRAHFTA